MILIIGASGGIGQYLARHFIDDGNSVAGTYNRNKCESLPSNSFVQLDITDSDAVEHWLHQIKDSLERITVINCVGINYNCFGHKADQEEWEAVVNVNLCGTFNIIRSILPFMREQKYGRIINLSSVVPKIGVMGTSAYAASKSGLWGMTKSLVKENAALGITINNLNLGYIDAGMINDIPANILDSARAMIPAKRFGLPVEIYEVIKMLIKVEYINAANIDVNGGI